MASNRHLGRIVILQSLYEYEFHLEFEQTAELDEIIARNLTQYDKDIDDEEFVYGVVRGVVLKMDQLDKTLAPLAPDWPIEQIARIDRAILRLGLWELLHNDSVPPKVVINESVELAKEFGGDNSSKFINGVLGSAYREKYGDEKPVEDSKPATKTKAKAKPKVKADPKPKAKPKPKPKSGKDKK